MAAMAVLHDPAQLTRLVAACQARARITLSFVGWGVCTENLNSDVVVMEAAEEWM